MQANRAETQPLLISKKGAAMMLGVSVRTVEHLIARKELQAIRIGKRRLLPMAALKRFAKRDHAICAASSARNPS